MIPAAHAPPKESAFEGRRRAEWEELDALTRRAQRGLRSLETSEVVRYVPLYRNVCSDLAAAEAARYSAPLVEYLRGLVADAHTVVYGRETKRSSRGSPGGPLSRDQGRGLRHAWLVAFPRAVRRRRRAMLLAAALFFVPALVGLLLALHQPTIAFRIVPEAMLRPLTEAYARGFGDGRGADQDAMMAGFYVYNNVGIALRCFALGIFGGLGSAFYLVQNGLSIGATLGYVASQGAIRHQAMGANIGVFIVGHGSLELGAIVLAGGSGLSMGWSLVAPGELPRVVSLQRRARELLVIVGGASVMLVMAAALEAFWSASSAPDSVKVGVGAMLFVLVLAYVLLGGRSGASDAEEASP